VGPRTSDASGKDGRRQDEAEGDGESRRHADQQRSPCLPVDWTELVRWVGVVVVAVALAMVVRTMGFCGEIARVMEATVGLAMGSLVGAGLVA